MRWCAYSVRADERTHVTTPNDMTSTPGTAPVQMMQLLYGSLAAHLVTVVADFAADQP